MNSDRVVIADLYYNMQKCGTYIFLKVKTDQYVRIEDVNSIFDLSYPKIKKMRIYETTGACNIDKDSIRPYFPKKENKSLKKIKSELNNHKLVS
jgi:hypothetical protein